MSPVAMHSAALPARYFERLAHALERLLPLQRQLLEAVRAKQAALVAVDLPGVEAAMAREAALLKEIQQGEAVRQDTLRQLDRCFELGRGQDLRLEDLLPLAPEPYRTRLIALRQRLQDVAAEVQTANRLNRSLTGQSLRHVASFLSAVGGGAIAEPTYGARGPLPPRGQSLLVDRIA